MSERNTVVRSLHDVGLGAWFGGTLMGAVGLNGATSQAADPAERLRLASRGWARWAPINAAAIGANVIGGLGLLVGNKGRLGLQRQARANTLAKTALTGVGIALTAYSGYLGRTVDELSHEGGAGATEPSTGASPQLASAQSKLKVCQWAIPAVTGVLIVMGAQQGEQQRPFAGLLGH